ncbi:MAG: DNA polymerase III subunit delta [Bacteroidota bacterium]
MAWIKGKKDKYPSYADFSARTKGKAYGPVYLFIGAEDFLIDECIHSIVGDLLTPNTKSFNLDMLDGEKVDAKDALAHAAAYPMTSERRVVVVKDFDAMTGSEAAKSILSQYIQKPLETTCLVLVAEKPDFRTKPFNELKRKEVVFEFAPLYDNRIPDWIESRCGSFGTMIDAEACRLLHASVGNSLRVLNNELDKLLIYISDRKRITADDVVHVVGVTKENSIFDLQKALGQANLQKALTIVQRMVETGDSPQGIIVMLTRYFTTLWKIQELQMHGSSEDIIAGEVKISPYFLKEYITASQKFSRGRFESIFKALLQADIDLKSSSSEPLACMTLLVYYCARPERQNERSFA